jgi:hypothetical protein
MLQEVHAAAGEGNVAFLSTPSLYFSLEQVGSITTLVCNHAIEQGAVASVGSAKRDDAGMAQCCVEVGRAPAPSSVEDFLAYMLSSCCKMLHFSRTIL